MEWDDEDAASEYLPILTSLSNACEDGLPIFPRLNALQFRYRNPVGPCDISLLGVTLSSSIRRLDINFESECRELVITSGEQMAQIFATVSNVALSLRQVFVILMSTTENIHILQNPFQF